MAIIGLIGFDNCANVTDAENLLNCNAANGNSSISAGRFGGNCYAVGYNNNFVRNYPSPPNVALTGFAALTNWNEGSSTFYYFDSNATTHVCFTITSAGVFQAYGGSVGGTLLGSAPVPSYSPTAWFYFEIGVLFSNTAGQIQVWVEGVQILNLSNIKTMYGTAGQAAASQACWTQFGRGNEVWLIDDIYFATSFADVQGERRVQTLTPVAASGSPQWTPLSGTNLSNVQSITPDGDTTYNSSVTPGQTDLFTMSSLSPNTISVTCVQPDILARKDDAQNRLLSTVVQSGSQTSTGTPVSINNVYQTIPGAQLVTDPNTSGSWTVAAVNALVVGYTEVS